ncbi:MAG: DinB family protein [Armatimonadetes bacterium]|nr:DinB family protein [Armatimonadota bacterium]
MGPIGQALSAQSERQWAQLGACLEQLDEATACRGEGILVPKRLLAHIIETVDFYLAPSPDEYAWGGTIGDWEGTPTDGFPSLAAFARYHADVAERLREWFGRHDDEALLGGNPFPWTGANPAERMMYVMRHTAQHLGEINALLRTWGLPLVGWR